MRRLIVRGESRAPHIRLLPPKPSLLGFRSALLLAAAGMVLPAMAQADDQSQVETVVVTGTMFHRSETPSPVTVLTRDQINNSSLTTVSDVVRSLTSDNSGTIPTAFGGGFAAGASGVALRGLTVNSTLVLIDGRRTANYPLADDGERGFVDLNTIPLDAVSRVEVLKDGASSLYGTDAIAGVVNIILDDSYQGVGGEAEVGTSQHGGGDMRRLTARFGGGDLGTDHYNAYIDFEYEVDDRIGVGQRGFPFNTNNLTSLGGVDLNPQPSLGSGSIYGSVTPGTLSNPNDVTTGVPLPGAVSQPLRACPASAPRTTDSFGNVFCEQDTALYGDDQPYENRFGVYSRFTIDFNAHAQAYLSASYFQNDVTIDGAPSQIESSTPNNTNSIALPARLPDGALNPNDPFAAQGYAALINYAFGDIRSISFENDHMFRGVLGMKGDYWGWDYDGAFVAAHSWLGTSNLGFINYNQLISDVVNGTYNFVDPSQNSAATLGALSPPALKTSTTDMDSVDLNATRDTFDLPGGPLEVGLGVQGRYEATYDPDLNPNLSYQGLGVAHTIGHHSVFSAYGELSAPVISTLELDASGRYDHYSDFGGNFSPKAGFKWKPIDQVMLRGTYSEGFRAPSFAENGSSASEGFITYTPPQNFINAHGNDGYVQPYSLALLSSANAGVRPETSRSFTGGTVVRPFDDQSLVVSLDYYNIRKSKVIAQDDPSIALNDYFAGIPIPQGYVITLDNPDPLHPNAPRRPVVVSSPYINADSLMTDGFDLDFSTALKLPYGIGYNGELNVTDIMHYVFIFPGEAPSSYVGTQSPYNLSSGAGTPRWRGSWASTFTYQDASLTGTLYYTSGMWENGVDVVGPGIGPNFCLYPLPASCQTRGFWDFDLEGRYKIRDGVEIFGAVRNLFDAGPPLDPADYAGVNYNPTYAQDGIIGRFLSVGVRVNF